MSGYDSIPQSWQLTLDDVQVRAADAACFHAKQHLARAGFGNRSLFDRQHSRAAPQHCRAHVTFFFMGKLYESAKL